jgi:hypothetical protein
MSFRGGKKHPSSSLLAAIASYTCGEGTSMATVSPTPRRFTVDEYYRLGETGILTPDERVELIEGEIIQMPPIGSPHAPALDD